jgi:hypothetical protein
MKIREREHLDRVAKLGCIACEKDGNYGTPACLHHIRAGQGMAQRATWMEVIPLCHIHHQYGGPGVAFHASPRMFEAKYGTEKELLKEVLKRLYGEKNTPDSE